ncbi:MAG: MopE-related protein [Pseudomonadota bacterium]
MSRLSLVLLPLLLGAAACHNVGGVTSDADGDGYDFAADCDDTDASVHPGADELCNGLDDDCDGEIDEEAVDAPGWHVDNDADGYGDPEGAVESCEPIEGLLEDGSDCDDADASVHPDAIEIWYDGVDTDCDGWSDYDADRDGHDSDGWGGDDCDDTEPTINPDAVETWYDGVDADCAGDDDYDQDHDGFDTSLDCDDTDALVYPGAIEVWYDGVDTDCDGWSDYDQDLDGFDAGEHGGDDCDDLDAAVNPSAEDLPYDGLDSDCDGHSDFDADYDGHDSDAWHGDDCDDGDATIYPGAPETWYDGIDSDCAADDDYDQDVDGYQLTADCDDTDASVFPGATDTWYDGVDQDCDGHSDYDADYDGHDSDAHGGDDCDDTDGAISPSAEELCDLADNDCDGAVDEDDAADAPTWYTDADGDLWGDPTSGITACNQPAGTIADGTDCDDTDASLNQDDADGDGFSTCDEDCDDAEPTTYPGATEVAGDGVDNDCDGEIDNDADTWLVTTPGDFELGGQDGNGLLTINDDGELGLARLVTGIGAAAGTTSLPYDLSSMGVVATGGYLYVAGGNTGSYTYSNDVLSAPLGSSGAVGSWNSSISALPTATTVGAFMTDGHCLIFAGGMTSSDYTAEEVYTAELNGDGTISSWSAQASLSTGVSYAVGAAMRGYVYVIGGEYASSYYYTSPTATVQYARLDPDCTIDSWSTTTSLPAARSYAGIAMAGDSIYVVGGEDTSGNTSASVYRASPGTIGTISSWSTEASLPSSRARPGVAVLDGYLIAAGGEDSSGNLADEIYFSAIASSDALGTWATSSTSLPEGTYNHRLASWQGHIYRVGGHLYYSYYGASRTDTVDYLTASHSSATSARQTALSYTFDLGSSAELVRLSWVLTSVSDGTAAVWYRSASTTGNAGAWTSLGSTSPATLSGTGRYVDVYVLLSSSTGDASTLDEIELAYRP